MRKLIVVEFMTLDGVFEAPEEWQTAYFSDDVVAEIRSTIHSTESSLLGRKTYEIFAASWPLRTHNEFGIADKLNSEPKFVVSSTLQTVSWNNTTLIRENFTEEIRKLKQQPGGDIRVAGSATLAQSLAQAGLVDEYWLLVHPIVLGGGKRLFQEGVRRLELELMDAKVFRSGVVLLRYRPAKVEA